MVVVVVSSRIGEIVLKMRGWTVGDISGASINLDFQGSSHGRGITTAPRSAAMGTEGESDSPREQVETLLEHQ